METPPPPRSRAALNKSSRRRMTRGKKVSSSRPVFTPECHGRTRGTHSARRCFPPAWRGATVPPCGVRPERSSRDLRHPGSSAAADPGGGSDSRVGSAHLRRCQGPSRLTARLASSTTLFPPELLCGFSPARSRGREAARDGATVATYLLSERKNRHEALRGLFTTNTDDHVDQREMFPRLNFQSNTGGK